MKKNTKEMIWNFIDKKDHDSCWMYKGSTFKGRYGRFFFNGKSHLSHRTVYELIYGDIKDDLFVMHRCNNKLCCNPDHLTLGTNQENQLHAVYSNAWKLGESGIRGVGYDKKRNYWTSQCFENGKRKNLYTGPDKEKAISARKQWEESNLENAKKINIGEIK